MPTATEAGGVHVTKPLIRKVGLEAGARGGNQLSDVALSGRAGAGGHGSRVTQGAR